MGWKWPVRVPVQVTLRGLLATEKAPEALRGQVFSWLQVAGFTKTDARLVNQDGSPVTLDGRRVLTQFRGDRDRVLARGLVRRELRSQWRAGALDLTMRFRPSQRRDCIPIVVIVTALFVALLMAHGHALTGPTGPGPLPLQVMGYSFVLLQVVGAPIFLGSLMAYLMIQASSPVKLLRVTREWIEFTVRDGDPQRQLWRNLRDRRGSVLLWTDGSRIRLPINDVRLMCLFKLLDTDLLGIEQKPFKLATVGTFVRLTVVGLLLCAGALWIFYYLIGQGLFPGPLPVRQMIFLSLYGPGMLAFLVLLTYAPRWMSRRFRHWSRARNAAPSAAGPHPVAPHR